jgi:hypothetical protein
VVLACCSRSAWEAAKPLPKRAAKAASAVDKAVLDWEFGERLKTDPFGASKVACRNMVSDQGQTWRRSKMDVKVD